MTLEALPVVYKGALYWRDLRSTRVPKASHPCNSSLMPTLAHIPVKSQKCNLCTAHVKINVFRGKNLPKEGMKFTTGKFDGNKVHFFVFSLFQKKCTVLQETRFNFYGTAS